MGRPRVAAVVAVVLAVLMTTLWFATESPARSYQAEQQFEEAALQDLQARHTLRGQAWAAELFGRRYGRNLLA